MLIDGVRKTDTLVAVQIALFIRNIPISISTIGLVFYLISWSISKY